MSALTARGSTRRWRRLRAFVLRRDGHACRVELADGSLCGAYATDAGHIVARQLGGTDDPANLRAECAYHNRRAGALLRHGQLNDPVPHYRSEGW